MNSFKLIKWNSNINSICFLLLGILLLFFPEESLSIGGYLIASILLLAGLSIVARTIKNKGIETNGDGINLMLSIAAIVLSITIFTDATWIIRMINIFVGIIILMTSIMNLLDLLKFTKNRTTSWWIYFILVMLIIVIGIIVIINPIFLANIITRTVGCALIINTVITLFLNRKVKNYLMIQEKN